jgi:hypothetical protein
LTTKGAASWLRVSLVEKVKQGEDFDVRSIGFIEILKRALA